MNIYTKGAFKDIGGFQKGGQIQEPRPGATQTGNAHVKVTVKEMLDLQGCGEIELLSIWILRCPRQKFTFSERELLGK